MEGACPECGASVPEGSSCRDHLDSLLLLEWKIIGEGEAPEQDGLDARAASYLAHFYAVSTYRLQHPDSMNGTAQALAGLREAVADSLAGRVTLSELLIRVRRNIDGSTRVTRRPGEPAVPWKRGGWPMTINDVLTGEAERTAYARRVELWARSSVQALDACGG